MGSILLLIVIVVIAVVLGRPNKTVNNIYIFNGDDNSSSSKS